MGLLLDDEGGTLKTSAAMMPFQNRPVGLKLLDESWFGKDNLQMSLVSYNLILL
jgi:hypothetical protein